jgi:pyruvate/2-oxoglutarate/acetoin dehydrogenase E1 component
MQNAKVIDQQNDNKELYGQAVRSNYGEAIRHGFEYLLSHHPEVFVIGQGVWSPWYVGSSMTDLDKKFGKERVIDCPVSEAATTGMAVGAGLCGYKTIMIHPRIDFMILACDAMVNQAAKWGHMLGGQDFPNVTIRGIVNRGGEQGAQHSQALHSWFSHIPGLRVVMPATAQDARDLLIAATLCPDPVLYIDDRWCYDAEADLPAVDESKLDLRDIKPQILQEGSDITIVGASYSTKLSLDAAEELQAQGISAEVVDLRVLNPLDMSDVIASVKKTGRLLAVDGSWKTCGLAGEIIAGCSEALNPSDWKAAPQRITLPDAPAPTSKVLEEIYYPDKDMVIKTSLGMMG